MRQLVMSYLGREHNIASERLGRWPTMSRFFPFDARRGYFRPQRIALPVGRSDQAKFLVKDLQQALKKEGFYKGPEDGVFDGEVRLAVEEYQKARGLPADGIAGPKTLKGLGLY